MACQRLRVCHQPASVEGDARAEAGPDGVSRPVYAARAEPRGARGVR